MGYHRADGQVGTRNYWIVLPLVFCENRNVDRMREALEEELGYGSQPSYRQHVRQLMERQRPVGERFRSLTLAPNERRKDGAPRISLPGRTEWNRARFSKNLDGIRFLTHTGGCGGTRQDAQALCGLLAGYIHHPNVAGATVLSLGCQNAQASMLLDELRARDPQLAKPVLLFDHQRSGSRDGADDREGAGGRPSLRWLKPIASSVRPRRSPHSTVGLEVRRLGWIQRHLRQSDGWLRVRPAGWRGRRHAAVGVSRAARRGAGTYQSLRQRCAGAALFSI